MLAASPANIARPGTWGGRGQARVWVRSETAQEPAGQGRRLWPVPSPAASLLSFPAWGFFLEFLGLWDGPGVSS